MANSNFQIVFNQFCTPVYAVTWLETQANVAGLDSTIKASFQNVIDMLKEAMRLDALLLTPGRGLKNDDGVLCTSNVRSAFFVGRPDAIDRLLDYMSITNVVYGSSTDKCLQFDVKYTMQAWYSTMSTTLRFLEAMRSSSEGLKKSLDSDPIYLSLVKARNTLIEGAREWTDGQWLPQDIPYPWKESDFGFAPGSDYADGGGDAISSLFRLVALGAIGYSIYRSFKDR